MADIVVKVCDLCGEKGADLWRVGKDGVVEVDLCPSCGTPLANAVAVGRVPAGQRRTYRRFQKVELPPQPGDKPATPPRRARKAP